MRFSMVLLYNENEEKSRELARWVKARSYGIVCRNDREIKTPRLITESDREVEGEDRIKEYLVDRFGSRSPI